MVPRDYRKHVDTRTVAELELLAPSFSKWDREYINSAMWGKYIFPELDDHHKRAEILQCIHSQNCLIPSLRTFFEDQKYLEPASKILRTLLGLPGNRPLWIEFKGNFRLPNQSIYFEYSEGRLQNLDNPSIDRKSHMKFAYLQLWMFCLRHYPEMTSHTPKIGRKRKLMERDDFQTFESMSKLTSRDYNPARFQELAKLALQLGLRTDNILRLAGEDADDARARHFLTSARPNFNGERQEQIAQISHILKTMKEPELALVAPRFIDDNTRLWPKDRRCGSPWDKDHGKDRSALFVTLFSFPISWGETITSLFVKRAVLEAFFQPQKSPVCLKHSSVSHMLN